MNGVILALDVVSKRIGSEVQVSWYLYILLAESLEAIRIFDEIIGGGDKNCVCVTCFIK